MGCTNLAFPGFAFPGMNFRRCVAERVNAALAIDALSLDEGFILQTSPTITAETSSSTEDDLQTQEWVIVPHETDPTLSRSFWSAWDEADATPSGVYTAVGPIDTPWVLSDVQQILSEATASAATSGGLNYLRVTGVDFYEGAYTLFLSGTANCYLATFDGSTATLNTTPFLTQSGQGRSDSGAVTLAAPIRHGATLYVIYSVSAATPAARYWVARRDAEAWLKIGSDPILAPTEASTDADGMEFHFAIQFGDDTTGRIEMTYEGFNGSHWGGHGSYSQVIAGDFEAALLAPFTKQGVIIPHDPATSYAQVHVATPTLFVTPDEVVHCCVQGSNNAGSGNGSVWKSGRGTLIPAS